MSDTKVSRYDIDDTNEMGIPCTAYMRECESGYYVDYYAYQKLSQRNASLVEALEEIIAINIPAVSIAKEIARQAIAAHKEVKP